MEKYAPAPSWRRAADLQKRVLDGYFNPGANPLKVLIKPAPEMITSVPFFWKELPVLETLLLTLNCPNKHYLHKALYPYKGGLQCR